jgi:hypothetical protein
MSGNAARHAGLACLILATAIATGCGPRPKFADSTPSSAAAAPTPGASVVDANIDSGVYGFAGAQVAEGGQEGVIGECIWVFDESDRHQMAKGDCRAVEPGRFRLPLRPGKYVVRGPGGDQAIEVKRGQWTKVTSMVQLPLGP